MERRRPCWGAGAPDAARVAAHHQAWRWVGGPDGDHSGPEPEQPPHAEAAV